MLRKKTRHQSIGAAAVARGALEPDAEPCSAFAGPLPLSGRVTQLLDFELHLLELHRRLIEVSGGTML